MGMSITDSERLRKVEESIEEMRNGHVPGASDQPTKALYLRVSELEQRISDLCSRFDTLASRKKPGPKPKGI